MGSEIDACRGRKVVKVVNAAVPSALVVVAAVATTMGGCVATDGKDESNDSNNARVTETSIAMAWDDNSSDEDGFLVQRKQAGGTFEQVATIAPNVATYTDTGLTSGTQYCYRVAATRGSETSPFTNEVCATTLGGTAGSGLKGQYYNRKNFTALKVTRIDPNVDFDWGSASPDPSMGPETFSVRWTGQVQATASATYTFYTMSDDGVKLWVNGQLLIKNWTDHAPTEDSGTITLTAGQKYDIKMEMYENYGGATAQLLWSSPSTPKQVIPQTQLYPAE